MKPSFAETSTRFSFGMECQPASTVSRTTVSKLLPSSSCSPMHAKIITPVWCSETMGLTLALKSSSTIDASGSQRSPNFSVNGELWYIIPVGTSTSDVLLYRLNPVHSRPTRLLLQPAGVQLSADHASESFGILDWECWLISRSSCQSSLVITIYILFIPG